MKLIIQIPCYNEAETLAIALGALPREVNGFDKVEWLIINDGSIDDTVKVAQECGVDHIVNFKHNQGLAKGFMAGIQECLKQGADVIVNTDADNQYEAQDIPKLTQPIIDGNSEYVIIFLLLKSFYKNLVHGLLEKLVKQTYLTHLVVFVPLVENVLCNLMSITTIHTH